MLRLFYKALFSFIVTFFLVPIFINIALKYNIIDKPDGNLKNHERPTPYLGGIALYIGFLVAYSFSISVFEYPLIIVLGFLGFLGFIDDIFVLRASRKFLGQVFSAFYMLYSYSFFGLEHLSNIIFCFFWIVTIINAFNLIDIMDGLALTLAIISSGSFLLYALSINLSLAISTTLALFLGSLCAIFWYNKPLACIYLGDSGSHVIGGFLAFISLVIVNEIQQSFINVSLISSFITPILFLMIPLLEIVALIIIRTYKKIPFYQGSPDHFALYLKRKEWSIPAILSYTSFVSLLFASLSFLELYCFIKKPILIAIILSVIFVWIISIFIKNNNSVFQN